MPFPENNNRLVSVLHQCQCPRHAGYERHADEEKYGAMWRCETLQTMVSSGGGDLPAGFVDCVPDSMLRPLHDGDGVDEVIRRVGLPEQHETPIGVITSVLRSLGFEAQWP